MMLAHCFARIATTMKQKKLTKIDNQEMSKDFDLVLFYMKKSI